MRWQINSVFKRLQRDERGTVAIIFGFSIFFLVGVVGFAVDGSRAYGIAARTQSILDTASLAAAKMLDQFGSTDQDVKDKATAFFAANLAQHTDLGATFGTPLVEPHRGSQTVNVSVDVVVPTYFATLFGFPTFTFTRQSMVIYRTKGIELAMVLDTTGSMNDPAVAGGPKKKIEVMKTAALDVVANLLNTSPGVLNTNRIGVVPFSASVNVGGYLAQVASGTSVRGDTCVIERPGTASTTDVALTGLTRSRVMESSSGGKYSCPLGVMQPLTNDATALSTLITSLAPDGWTAGHMGMAWGWNLVSPNYASVFTGGNTPASYADQSVIKAVVIMTDGQFNTAYKSGDTSSDATQISESNAEFASLCTNMRLKKIRVYTIGFGLAGNPAAKQVLKDCVLDPADFFDAETDTQLVGAFANITEQLQTLRVAG
jgi:Flp pilus assembly protein TadG